MRLANGSAASYGWRSHDDPATPPHRGTYAGLFLVCLATLMYELLLTRVSASRRSITSPSWRCRSSPTDDRPFFFHTLRWRSIFNQLLWAQGATAFHIQAVFILGRAAGGHPRPDGPLHVVLLALATTRDVLRGAAPLFAIFARIGVGFMLVEISQMQQLPSRRAAALTPWLWGINGAVSVCASVLALAIALMWGISTSFWLGFACYAAALAAYTRAA